MTTLQFFAQQVPTWVTGEFHKLKHNIFKAQSFPHKSTNIMAKTKYPNTSECNQSDTHAVNHLK